MVTTGKLRRHRRPGVGLLNSLLTQERSALLGSAALLTCWSIGEAAVPATIGATVDDAIAPGSFGHLLLWISVLAGCFLLLSYGFRTGSRWGRFATTRQKHRLRGMIAASALNPARNRERQRLPGEVSSLAGADVDAATGVLQQVSMGGACVFGLIGCAGYLLWADPWVGIAIIIVTPLGMLLLRTVTPLIGRTSSHQQAGLADAGASAADILDGAEVLRGTGGESRAVGWYRNHSQVAAGAGIKAAGATGRLDASRVCISGSVLLIAATLGAWRVVEGMMTVGTLVGVLGVTAYFSGPLGTIVILVEGYARSAASAARIEEFLAVTANSAPDGASTKGGADQKASHTALSDPRLTVRLSGGLQVDCVPGCFTVLVSGDAETHRALREAVVLSEGTVLIDGIDARTVEPHLLPDLLRLSPHQPHLFEGTIRDNILGRGERVRPQEVTHEGVIPTEILVASGLQELVGALDDGLEHWVEAGGANLSGGQRQRVSLARSLSGGRLARVLIDPTTAVDSVTEAGIAEGLARLRKSSDQGTLMVMTTSPHILAVADEVIFFLTEGVQHRGTHRDLLRIDRYREVVSR